MRQQAIEHELRPFKLLDYVHDVQVIHYTNVSPLYQKVLFGVPSECASNAQTSGSEIDEIYPIILK